MDKQQRGLLLVEQEELKARDAAIRTDLLNKGGVLRDLGTALQQYPHLIVFSNAPDRLGEIGAELAYQPNPKSFEWRATEQLMNLRAFAELIQELRQIATRLRQVESQLLAATPGG